MLTINFFPRPRYHFEFFYMSLFTDSLSDLQKSFKLYLHMIQTCDTKFGVSAVICFEVMLITDTHTYKETEGTIAKNFIWGFRGPHQRIYPIEL